jgi:hypothetical protein
MVKHMGIWLLLFIVTLARAEHSHKFVLAQSGSINRTDTAGKTKNRHGLVIRPLLIPVRLANGKRIILAIGGRNYDSYCNSKCTKPKKPRSIKTKQ